MPHESKQVVVVIRDVLDDKAAQDQLRAHCQQGSRRLLISPGPGAYSTNALAGHVLGALGVRTHRVWHEPHQLRFEDMEPLRLPECEQLNLPFEHPPRRWGWADLRQGIRRPTPNGRNLHDAIQDTCAAGITELYVLRAHIIVSAAWSSLKFFARDCDVRLHLVVHGTADVSGRMRYLSDCRVISRPIMDSVSPAPWWEKPGFRRASVSESAPTPPQPDAADVPDPRRTAAA